MCTLCYLIWNLRPDLESSHYIASLRTLFYYFHLLNFSPPMLSPDHKCRWFFTRPKNFLQEMQFSLTSSWWALKMHQIGGETVRFQKGVQTGPPYYRFQLRGDLFFGGIFYTGEWIKTKLGNKGFRHVTRLSMIYSYNKKKCRVLPLAPNVENCDMAQ